MIVLLLKQENIVGYTIDIKTLILCLNSLVIHLLQSILQHILYYLHIINSSYTKLIRLLRVSCQRIQPTLNFLDISALFLCSFHQHIQGIN